MTELIVSDFAASLAWYRDGLQLDVERIDQANAFALFHSNGSRLAIKQGSARPGGVTVHFLVANLDETCRQLAGRNIERSQEIKSSSEGYRRAKYHDPDGYSIVLFQWEPPP